MNEYLDKIKLIWEQLAAKTVSLELLQKANKEKSERYDKKVAKLDARENDINARERITTKFESFEKAREAFQVEKDVFTDNLREVNELSMELEQLQVDNEKKEEKLDKMVKAYQNKSKRINKLEADLKIEKENLRKTILEEIKDKL